MLVLFFTVVVLFFISCAGALCFFHVRLGNDKSSSCRHFIVYLLSLRTSEIVISRNFFRHISFGTQGI